MEIKRICDEVSVCAQIDVSDLPRIAALGFRSIICNRPDQESEGQPDWDAIAAAAQEAGLKTAFQPVVSGQVCAQDGADFASVIADLPKPVFAYCRTGTRCAQLWSLSQRGQQPDDAITEAAAAAGYDVAGILARA